MQMKNRDNNLLVIVPVLFAAEILHNCRCGKEHKKDDGEQYVAQPSDRFCFDMGAAGLIPDRRAAVTQHLPRKPGGDEHHDRDAQPQPFDIGPEGTFPG